MDHEEPITRLCIRHSFYWLLADKAVVLPPCHSILANAYANADANANL